MLFRSKVFDFHGIVMPVFKEIDESNRNAKWLDKNVKKVLLRAFQDKKHDEWDIRWHHVGMYCDDNSEEHCILYDLAHLEDFEPNEDRDEFVQKFLDTLMERENARKEELQEKNSTE